MANYSEVIYCKDCKYRKTYYHRYNMYSYECSLWQKINIQPYDFCSRAEYKEENKDENI